MQWQIKHHRLLVQQQVDSLVLNTFFVQPNHHEANFFFEQKTKELKLKVREIAVYFSSVSLLFLSAESDTENVFIGSL